MIKLSTIPSLRFINFIYFNYKKTYNVAFTIFQFKKKKQAKDIT